MDDMIELYDVVKTLNTKHRSVLDDPLCESLQSLSTSNQECMFPILTLSSIDEGIGKKCKALGWDFTHSNCLNRSCPFFSQSPV